METEGERQDRATKLLEERVRRDTIVDSRLDGHDRRLAAINGSIERGVRASESLSDRVTALHATVNNLRADLHTKQEIDLALQTKADQNMKQQITRREFWLGIAVLVVTVIGIALNAGLI